LLRGRYFAESDDASRPRVVIINQALAKQYFPGEDPVGAEIIYNSDSPQPRIEIIGLVDDVKEGPLDVPARAAMYVPLNQQPASHFSVVVRTSQAEESALLTLTDVIHQLDPGLRFLRGKPCWIGFTIHRPHTFAGRRPGSQEPSQLSHWCWP